MKAFFQSFFGSFPNSIPFDVNANKIFLRIISGQSKGVFSFATTNFEDDGVVIAEKMAVPGTPVGKVGCRICHPGLNNIGEGIDLGKLL